MTMKKAWDKAEEKAKKVLVEKVDFESAPESERTRIGRPSRHD